MATAPDFTMYRILGSCNIIRKLGRKTLFIFYKSDTNGIMRFKQHFSASHYARQHKIIGHFDLDENNVAYVSNMSYKFFLKEYHNS